MKQSEQIVNILHLGTNGNPPTNNRRVYFLQYLGEKGAAVTFFCPTPLFMMPVFPYDLFNNPRIHIHREEHIMKSYTCIVEGKVAGTNFQSWAQDLANQLSLTGWVRNIADNKVEILIQGGAEAYATFREKLKTEAPVIDLVKVSCNAMDYDKDHESFSIRG